MRKRLSDIFLLIVALLFAGCGGCNGGDDNGTSDTGRDVGETIDAGDAGAAEMTEIVCTPGEVQGCREEDTPSIDVCNASGTAVEAGSCPNDPPQVCRNDECVEVTCIPGQRICIDDVTPQECNDDGSAWEELPTCDDGATCEAGNCLNRCQVAELTSSYVGCEYWAVELDNELLNENGAVPAEQEPPFAIVLANTSVDFDAV